MDKTRSFLSFLHVIHGVFGPQTGPFPSIVSFANKVLEGLVSEVVTHSDKEDLHMRFFGNPYVEAIPARITGRRPDTYEQPRDMVIVAFNKEQPVGYTDITEGLIHTLVTPGAR
jgi:hypothetical protein